MTEYNKSRQLVNSNKEKDGLSEALKVRVDSLEELKAYAKEGLASLSLELGLMVMSRMFEEEVTDICGPKGKHDRQRQAYRHGRDKTKVVYGGSKVEVASPRVRSKNGVEIPLTTLSLFQGEDQMNETIFKMLINGISTRKYERMTGLDDNEAQSVGKSTVSNRYQIGLEKVMDEFFNRRLEEDYIAIMLDGVSVGDMAVIVALGIDSDGKKKVLGLISGGTENHIVTKALLKDLVDRGLEPNIPRLFVLDGSSALHKAVVETFGTNAVIQRCQVHKKRNVLSYLPDSEQANVSLAISRAYLEFEYDPAYKQLTDLADRLEHSYPNAAKSLREGLEETLTVNKLNVPGKLRKTLSSTNPIESCNSTAKGVARRNKKYQNGEMVLKHMAAAYVMAEASFRRINGYREIPFLINSLSNLEVCSSTSVLITTA